MSKFDEKVAQYQAEMKKLGLSCDNDLLTKVTKGLGPSIYKADAETVSGTDEKELATVKNNFLIKKLGLKDGAKLDQAIANAIEKIGKSNRNKYRAIFYYLLVKELGQESKY
jgi:hypothetical protein